MLGLSQSHETTLDSVVCPLFCPTKMVSLVGHMSFQERKIIFSPAVNFVQPAS